MDRSAAMPITATLAQWEAFFRACEIPHERSKSHAAKFVEEFVRPRRLSTYTIGNYEELGVKQGDRVRIKGRWSCNFVPVVQLRGNLLGVRPLITLHREEFQKLPKKVISVLRHFSGVLRQLGFSGVDL